MRRDAGDDCRRFIFTRAGNWIASRRGSGWSSTESGIGAQILIDLGLKDIRVPDESSEEGRGHRRLRHSHRRPGAAESFDAEAHTSAVCNFQEKIL